MNYLNNLGKIIELHQRKRKGSSLKTIAIFSVLGVAIASVALVLLTQSCRTEIRNIVIRKANELDDDITTKRNEIKQTLENVDDESIGDIGVAMEDALKDIEAEKKSENH